MTILFAATERESFVVASGSISTSTSSSRFDSDFSRSAIEFPQDSAQVQVPAVAMGNLSEVWFHGLFAQELGFTFNSNIIEFRNSAGLGILRLFANSSTTVKLQYWNGSSWVDIGSPFTWTSTGNNTIDIRCKIDNSTGDFAFYWNGAVQAQLTGDTDQVAASAVDIILVRGWQASLPRQMSEVIVSTTSTLGQRVATLPPTATGTTSAWTGTFADVDESDINDSDFISSGTPSQVTTFGMADLSATAAGYDVVAFVAAARARHGATGPQNLQLATRTHSTDYYSSNVAGLTTSFANGFYEIWEDNPNTSVPWTTTEINAVEAGVKSIA